MFSEDAETANKKFQNVDDLQHLRVYSLVDKKEYEDLDLYMSEKKYPEKKRRQILKYIREGMSKSDGIEDCWQDKGLSIVVEATTENKSGLMFRVLPRTTAIDTYKLYTDLDNLPENERVRHAKDYRTFVELLDIKNIAQMRVIDATEKQEHERLAAFQHEKQMNKRMRRDVFAELRDTLREIIHAGQTRREMLKDKSDPPALLALFKSATPFGPLYSYSIIPVSQARQRLGS